MHEGGNLLRDALILLAAALAFVLLFRRLGLGATLGYLVAGALVGPQALGLIGEAEEKIVIAELGIVMLLFVVGLELSPARLWRMKRDIFGLGLMQVVACGIVITGIVALGTAGGWKAAFALGLALALSSTAQVLPMLQSGDRMKTPTGERAFAILLFQDLSIIPLITIVAVLSPFPDEGPGGAWLAIYTVGAVIALVAAGRFLIRPMFDLIGTLREREMFVVASLFTVIGAAAFMEYLGLSAALGAFIAGVMLADTPYRHELEADIEPFRSILLGLFFLAVGMILDLGAIAERPGFVIAMALALVATKATVITLIGKAFRMSWRAALALGLLLSQGGEFGFVLFTQAEGSGLLSPETASLFGAIVTISMATTPFLMIATRRLRNAMEPSAGEREEPIDENAAALVVGYGRFGQTVAQMLLAGGISVTLIDEKTDAIDVAERFGAKVYFGDGTRLDLLRQAGAANADLIAFCLDEDKIEPELVASVRQAFPEAKIFVRAYDRRSLIKLAGSDTDYVGREVLESAVVMARNALETLGQSIEAINNADDEYRRRDRERLSRQIETGDDQAAMEQILTPDVSR